MSADARSGLDAAPALSLSLPGATAWLLGYLLVGYLVAEFQPSPGASLWYPPIAVGIALLLRHGWRWWPLVLVADFCIAWAQYGSSFSAAAVAANTAGEVVLAVALLRRVGFSATLDEARDVLWLLLVGGVLAPAAGASLGSALVSLDETGSLSKWAELWPAWWLGDATGVVVFLPLLLLARPVAASATAAPDNPIGRAGVLERAAVVVLALASAAVALQVGFRDGSLRAGLLPLAFLPVLWSAVRLGRRFTAGLIVAIDLAWVMVFLLTARQTVSAPTDNLIDLQLFMLSLSAAGLALAVALASTRKARHELQQVLDELRLSEQGLRESEAKRQFALEAAGVGDWSMDLRNNVATRSMGHDRAFGYDAPVAEWGYETFLAHVHAEDRERVDTVYKAAMTGDGHYDVEFRAVWPDGSVHWLWSKGRFAIGDEGQPYNVAGILVDITRRRAEAEALRRSEQRYDLLFRHSLDGILQTHPDGRILAANPAACTLFSTDEASLIAGGRSAVVVPNDPRLAMLLQERARAGAVRGEITMKRADGTYFEADVSSVIYDRGVDAPLTSFFVRDITERLRGESRLRQQLARLDLLRETTRAIAERRDLASLFGELAGRLQARMPAALTGVALYSTGHQSVRLASVCTDGSDIGGALVVGAEVPVDANGLSRCLRGELVHEADLAALDFELPRRLLAGGLRSAVLAPLALDGEVFGLILVARAEAQAFSSGDCEFLHQLSEHVALAAHQARLYEDLQQAYERLQRSQQAVLLQERLRALGQMASGVAHDINNAVSPVALYTESLLDTEPGLSERTRRYLLTIQRAIDDVTHTVTRMREFSRERDPAAGLVAVQFNTLVPQVLELTRARWRDMPQQAGIAIDVDSTLQPSLPGVLATEGEIREALTNLVFNAVDAMPQGGRLRLGTAGHVDPDGQAEVALSVTDTGVGMDENTRRRCLEPFFTTKGERGTGLGLAMVYGTVQRHGGRIEIDSAPGQGTTVRLLFPVQTPMPAPVLPAAAEPAPALTLLLIDDDALLLESLGEILRGEGHQVQIALGGQAGIDALRQAVQTGARFDVVITDLGMPNVDGTQVAREAKALSPATPVVMLTGWGRRMSEDEERPEHVDLLLSKPPRLGELRAMARQFGEAGLSR